MGQLAGDRIIAPGDPNLQIITATGDWTRPAGLRGAWVRVVSGGGQGGGCIGAGTGQSEGGYGAGGGETERFYLASELDATVPCVIGAGGSGAA